MSCLGSGALCHLEGWREGPGTVLRAPGQLALSATLRSQPLKSRAVSHGASHLVSLSLSSVGQSGIGGSGTEGVLPPLPPQDPCKI